MNVWKKTNKPASCTKAPWEALIPQDIRYETMRRIRQECLEEYGYEFDECNKRLMCISKSCLGRPLPWKSKTAIPYLKKLQETQDIRNDELYINGCDKCPIFNTCNKPCPQIYDYTNKHQSDEVNLLYTESIDNMILNTSSNEIESNPIYPLFNNSEIPWDCISDLRQNIIKDYIYKQKDFKSISEKYNLTNQSRAKYEFYAGLTKLSEYAVIREFIKNNNNELTTKQLYIFTKVYTDNESLTTVAKTLNISKQSVQQTIKRVIENNCIKWNVFVYKENNKTIYNIPKILS